MKQKFSFGKRCENWIFMTAEEPYSKRTTPGNLIYQENWLTSEFDEL